MRNKLAAGGLAVVVGFLVATNPVVADAAKQITGKQIKNNSVTSKDIKNNNLKGKDVKDGSLTAADLAAGTIPKQVSQVKTFIAADAGFPVIAESTALSFLGPTTTVTVDGSDAVVVSGTIDIFGSTASDDFVYGICSRPAGSVAAPTLVGGPATLGNFIDIQVGANQSDSFSRSAAAVLPSGSHNVGMCGYAEPANTGTVSWTAVTGVAQVIEGTPVQAKVSARGSRTAPE